MKRGAAQKMRYCPAFHRRLTTSRHTRWLPVLSIGSLDLIYAVPTMYRVQSQPSVLCSLEFGRRFR